MVDPVGLVVLFLLHIAFCDKITNVETDYGNVRGQIKSVRDKNIQEFWGIPYAMPPVGKLRFRKPVPLKASSYSERTYGIDKQPSCHQDVYKSRKNEEDLFQGRRMWFPKSNVSEDCLYLNIWSPVTTKKLPVLVWIHGGSFTVGSSTLELYDGTYLSAMNDVVVVTINYRLGAIGFIHLGLKETVGNLGLYDQQTSLKWINKNIKYFNGDSSRVTLFGSSAGAASVAYHFIIPSSWPYFNNALMQGGSVLGRWASYRRDEVILRSQDVAKLISCYGDSEQMYKCLMAADPQSLSLAQWKVVEAFNDVPIGPFVDGDLITDEPLELVRSGKIKNSSLIAGFNEDEGMIFLQNRPSFRRTVRDDEVIEYAKVILKPMDNVLIRNVLDEYSKIFYSSNITNIMMLDDLIGDIVIKCPVMNFASYYSNAGNAVYVYSYEHISSGNPWPEWMGVLHGYEIDHFFGLPFNEKLGYTDSERQLSLSMMEALSNFASTGNPNKASNDDEDEMEWPLYSDNEKYRPFTTTTPVDSVLPHRRCAFWRGVNSIARCSDNSSFTSVCSYVLIFASVLFPVILSLS